MKTKYCLLLCALAVPAWAILKASDPPPARTSGRVLILDNDRTLEGDIERRGEQYCVRRPIGETWVPADKVLCLCGDLEEAWKFLQTRANLRDPDERLRLARWCLFHGLKPQALAEVTAAVELRPHHAESQRLMRSLQQSTPASTPPVARPPEPENLAVPSVPADFNPDALTPFTRRVQPILMNACACCHATGRGGSFKLTRAFEGGLLNHRATQQNLVAVLAEINRDRPQASVLLTKALSAHGEAELPPIKNRQTPTYRTLEEWVKVALADAPTQGSTAPVATFPAGEAKTFVEMVGAKPEAGPAASPIRPSTPASSSTNDRSPNATTAPPASPANGNPADPFDPLIFNRQMHDEKK